VFSHGRLVWLFKTDVPLMLLQLRVHETACLPKKSEAGTTRPRNSMHARQSSPEAIRSMPIQELPCFPPDTLLYQLWHATCSTTLRSPFTIDFPCGLLSVLI
jgi:hypothetical protein